jgi:hypothetical protein
MAERETSIEMTEEDIQVTMRFIATRMLEDGVQLNNPEQVLRWMILNPLPDAETVAAEEATTREAEKAKRIAALTKELTRLEGN